MRLGGGGAGQQRVCWQAQACRNEKGIALAPANAYRGRPGRSTHEGQLLLRPLFARRRGPNKAAVAVAHSNLETSWHLLTTGALYVDLGADYFDRRNDPALQVKRLQARIEALGFSVTVTDTAA